MPRTVHQAGVRRSRSKAIIPTRVRRAKLAAMLATPKVPEYRFTFAWTPTDRRSLDFLRAADEGKVDECVDLLREDEDGVKALINFQSPWGHDMTALHISCRDGNVKLLSVFLAHEEVDINIHDSANQTPVEHAIMYNHAPAFLILIARPDIRLRIRELYTAAIHGRTMMARMLIGKGIDVNEQICGSTVYQCCVTSNGNSRTEICRMLLRTPGIKVNTEDRCHRAPPHHASGYFGGTDALRLCLISYFMNQKEERKIEQKGFKDANGRRHRAHGGRSDHRGRRGVWIRRHKVRWGRW